MMKKGILFTAAASVLCLASCSQDDFAPVQDANDNGNVTFTVSLNDKPATRANDATKFTFGDGTSAKKLYYAVYDVTDKDSDAKLVINSDTKFEDYSLTTTVTLNLATGRDYKVVFFASNGTGTHDVYHFDAANKTVTIDYDKSEQAEDQIVDNDCFYNAITVSKTDIGQSLSVLLHRPVAQINFGTTDFNEKSVQAYKDLRTTVTSTAYETLNLLDGTVSDRTEITTKVACRPITEEYGTFPVAGHFAYLHCSYVLMPTDDKEIGEVTLNVYDGAQEIFSLPVSNVPLQANYRTNIYGSLLTTQTDITVVKDEVFNGDYIFNAEGWDGTVAEELPEIENNVLTISTPQELAKLAETVNSGTSYKGITITLGNNLDLNGFNWTPIGTTSNAFEGSFDGNGNTISNLTIVNTEKAEPIGLFGKAWPAGDFKNVKFEHVSLTSHVYQGGAPVGTLIGSGNLGTISGVSVKDVVIRANRQSGGIIGAIYGSISNCEAENVDIELIPNKDYEKLPIVGNTLVTTNADKAGGIVGFDAEGKGNFTNNSVSDVKIIGYRDMGGLFGMIYNQTYSGNTAKNVQITRAHVDGVFGGVLNEPNHGPIFGRNSGATDAGNNTFSKYTYIDHKGTASNWSTEQDWQ